MRNNQNRMTIKRVFLLLLSLLLTLFLGINIPLMGANKTEILWDSWGVPHIYGKDSESLFQAFGWAQTQSHGDLILRLYGQARGKAAEYWGEEYLPSDQYVRTMGIPARAKEWYNQQSLSMQSYLNAFAQGINNYVQEHPDQVDEDVKVVLPVNGVDVLAHMQRVVNFHFVVNPRQLISLKTDKLNGGSNAWAIAPSNSASGKAMLLANPHLPWSDLYLWYEAQLKAPAIDVYGATLVGMPVLAIAFNDHLGWTFTVNTFDGADIYQLTLSDEGYLWDGEVKPLEKDTQLLKVKQTDGTFREEKLIVKNSIHGPIIAQEENQAFALRVVGLDQPNMAQQFWQMGQATNLNQFEEALQQLQLPLFNLLYADQQGKVFYIFNGQIPVRSKGDWNYWQGIIPGDTSDTLWTKYHPYRDLPLLRNPINGWLQNTNDPPWTSTFPSALDPQDYPSYFAPNSLGATNNIFRPQRSIKMLQENEQISFEEMITKKFSSRLEMADRLLDDLIPVARLLANPIGIEAANVLDAWDRQANADSKGAVLFTLWALSFRNSDLFAKPWDEDAPLNTPDKLADFNTALGVLEGVAAQMQLLYGSLDVSWGEIVRMNYGKENLPASGSYGNLGSFRVLNTIPTDDERFQVVAGDSYIAAIEFTNPVKAKALTVYGNATQPGSPHVGDQLSLYAQGELRPVWRKPKEIKAHLESKQVF